MRWIKVLQHRLTVDEQARSIPSRQFHECINAQMDNMDRILRLLKSTTIPGSVTSIHASPHRRVIAATAMKAWHWGWIDARMSTAGFHLW